MWRARANSRRRVLNGYRPQRAFNGHRAGSSKAETYCRYSHERTRQAVEADRPELGDQSLDHARLCTDAALREEINSKTLRTQQLGA
jgi:hypothetical protein